MMQHRLAFAFAVSLLACGSSSSSPEVGAKVDPASDASDAGDVAQGDAGGGVVPGEDASAADAGGDVVSTGTDAGSAEDASDGGEADAAPAADAAPFVPPASAWGCMLGDQRGYVLRPFFPCTAAPATPYPSPTIPGDGYPSPYCADTTPPPPPKSDFLAQCKVIGECIGAGCPVVSYGVTTHGCTSDADCAGMPNNATSDAGAGCKGFLSAYDGGSLRLCAN